MNILLIILPTILGLAAGISLRFYLTRFKLQQVNFAAQRLEQEAQERSKALIEKTHQEEKGNKRNLQEAFEEEYQQTHEDLVSSEKELDRKQSSLDVLDKELQALLESQKEQEQALNKTIEGLMQQRHALGDQKKNILHSMAERAGLSVEEALQVLVDDNVERARHDTQQFLFSQDEELRANATKIAQHIFDIACDRFAGIPEPDRWINSVPVENQEMRALLSNEGGDFFKSFKELLNTEIWVDEDSRTAHIKADAPVLREQSRRVLREVVEKDIRSAERLQDLIKQTGEQLKREVAEAGKKSVASLKLHNVPAKVSDLIGRLQYRLSYSQNQWHHAMEAAILAGLIASELGTDISKARRATIFHDIGKALTHEQEGSHAVLGAHILREEGEAPEIINAVASHHGDVPAQTPTAHIVAMADALSGGRPGARREMVTAYMRRIEELENVVNSFNEVKRIDVMHAGREVRVFVGEEEFNAENDNAYADNGLTDADIKPLARNIADSIEAQMEFPGQIKVTVIRETRVVTVAK